MSSAKWRPFCLGLNVLTETWISNYSHGVCGMQLHIHAIQRQFSQTAVQVMVDELSHHHIYVGAITYSPLFVLVKCPPGDHFQKVLWGNYFQSWEIWCFNKYNVTHRAPLSNLIGTWISNYKMWDEMTYPFSNFNGATCKVLQWVSNFIPHFTRCVITYPCWVSPCRISLEYGQLWCDILCHAAFAATEEDESYFEKTSRLI